jgi:hypothetical protein
MRSVSGRTKGAAGVALTILAWEALRGAHVLNPSSVPGMYATFLHVV